MAVAPLAAIKGNTEPRIFTPPLYPWSLGDMANDFADIAEMPLMPWQRWLFNAALELREPWTEDTPGPPNFRYRTVVVLVARQNGKTVVLALRALFGMYVLRERLALSMAQNLRIALECWES